MKKITLLLASVVLSLGAMAQTMGYETKAKLASADLNAKTTPTMIAIKNLSATNNVFFVGNTGAAPYSKAWNLDGEAVFVWEPVTEGEAGSYYLKKLDGTYMQTTAPKDFGAKETAAVFTTTNPTSKGSGSTSFNGDGDSQNFINGNDDANLVRFVTAGKWINVQNGASGTPVYNSGTGGWTIHYVYAVESRELVECAYSFKYNDVEVATQTTTVFAGSEYPDYTVTIPYGYTVDAKPEGTVAADATVEITLTKTSELPFEVAADVENITTWYYVIYHTSNDRGCYIEALSDGKIEWADKSVAEGEEKAHLWGFVGDAWGLKVVSKTGKAITSLNSDGFAVLGEVADATAFMAVASRVDGNVCLKYPNDGDFLNAQNGSMKSWWDSDQGSAFVVEEYVVPEGPTGVESVEAQEAAVIYDLAGRRVENPTKGIYIVNGKKVVIK